MTASQQIRCSFCGKSESDTNKIIVGPEGHYICNECVELCQDILNEEPLEGSLDTRRKILSPRTPLRVLNRAAATRAQENRLCGKCRKMCNPVELVFAAFDANVQSEPGPTPHVISVEELRSSPKPICLACARELVLKSLEKRQCPLCHESRLAHEFPDPELRVCLRCAQTAVWLLEHRHSEPDVLMAMRALLEGGMHALFDHVVRVAKFSKLHRLAFEGAALQALRRVGLIPRNEFYVPEAAVGFIADSCHTDGVWLRVESARVPEANIEFTSPVL